MDGLHPVPRALVSIMPLALAACYGSEAPVITSDATTDGATRPCFEVCTDRYFSDMEGCIDERRSCLLECGGFGDHECRERCEEGLDGCTAGLEDEIEGCLGACPCWPAFQDCVDRCGDPGDPCWEACEREFSDCSGHDLVGMGGCVEGCAYASLGCGDGCPETGWDSWVDCTTDCERSFARCMSGCF